jgi:hypothetical protein
MATKLKKSELIPKSKLGIDKTFKICWNCMFWWPENGRCPMVPDKFSRPPTYWSNFPYNHNCPNSRLFRYKLDYLYEDYDKFVYKGR